MMRTANGSAKMLPSSTSWCTARWRAAPQAVRLGCCGCIASGQIIEADLEPGFRRLHRLAAQVLDLEPSRRRFFVRQRGHDRGVDFLEVGTVLGMGEDQPALLGHPGEDLGADFVGVHPFLERGAELFELARARRGEAAVLEAVGAL